MARRKASAQSTEGRFIASRIQDARRRGATNAEIGDAFGMNERTVRKIVAGETPGTRVFARKMAPPKGERRASTPNIFRADIELDDGMVRTVNVKIPDLPTRTGKGAPTPFDVFRLPDLQQVADAEGRAMQRRYNMGDARAPRFVGLRQIVRRRAPKLVTIRGVVS